MRVRVIGAGILGAAAADALARRGVDVALCDAGEAPDPLASSFDESKVIRAAYGAQTDRYGPLVLEALEAWRALERDVGTKLLHATGTLVLRPTVGTSGFAEQSSEGLERLGVRPLWLDAAEGRRRFPSLSWHDLAAALLDPTGGWLAATAATRALIARAVAHGATLRAHTPCVRHPDGRLAPVEAEAADVDVTVVAAGPWVRRLVDAPATATRQQVAWFWPTTRPPADLPVWLYDLDGDGWYGFPVHPNGGVKVGLHAWADPCDPDVDRTPDEAFLTAARNFVRRAVPGIDPSSPATARVCLYTNAPSGDLALYWEGPSRDVLVTGLGSGHGFKFGPAWGRMVADVVLGAAPPPWADPRAATPGRTVY